jgi:hypothetical protein
VAAIAAGVRNDEADLALAIVVPLRPELGVAKLSALSLASLNAIDPKEQHLISFMGEAIGRTALTDLNRSEVEVDCA